MAETEKITINLGVVDLGKIDLLTEQGFYSNRTDLIRTAIRNQLETHNRELTETIQRKAMVVGVLIYDAGDLEEKRYRNEMLNITVVGMFIFADDITPELALATINSVKVHGIFKASEAVKQALVAKIDN